MIVDDPAGLTSLHREAPTALSALPSGGLLLDFGRVAFGNLEITAPPGVTGTVDVHFGEAFSRGRIDRNPPGSVRYARVTASLGTGDDPVVVSPPPDERNTNELAVLLSREWGAVLPFRWVEIEGWPVGAPEPHVVRRAAYAASWDDAAAAFSCSDPFYDRLWELCRWTIKATTFAGVYVDGDRERRAYEADAYLNQLSHYACDGDIRMARATFRHLVRKPTRSTEWALHMVFIAHADWMHTGEVCLSREHYSELMSKLLLDRAREDGLIAGTPEQMANDIVDWPAGERDGFEFMPVNTVVNAFHVRALTLMAELARALGRVDDAEDLERREVRARAAVNRVLLDPVSGLYRDGEGTDHSSIHANLFPLAFGLVPEAKRPRIVDFLIERGMACSVYAAQYLLEALFDAEADEAAFALIMADGDRSWKHMLASGTTLTWEAWDQRYKPNQDWNHAWGAAPANLLPRYVAGVQVASPGWERVRIRPHPGPLTHCEATVPTPRGPIVVRWTKEAESFVLDLELPEGSSAVLEIPRGAANMALLDGRPVETRVHAGRAVLTVPLSGSHRIVVR